jgi:hypothetical protein
MKGFVSSWVLITFGLEAMTIKVQTYFSRQEILVLTNHMAEAAGQLEFNFLTYRHGSRDNWYTHICLSVVLFFHTPQEPIIKASGLIYVQWAPKVSKRK